MLRKGEAPVAQLSLGRQESFVPEIKNEKVSRDTLKFKDDDGTEIIIMKAVKDDETGEMVAADVLDAAMVTARFRNIAERKGKVDLAFQVIVPASMRDSRWQLRFYPDMYVLEDSIRLEPVIITGAAYRKAQLRGYEQYDKFLSRIVEDSTAFINVRQLEIFLKRNIPALYAFKTDSTYVSDEEFLSAYGVSEQQAIDHYTNKFAKNMNERRKARKDKMYARYVKSPIVTDGIRLDTVMVTSEGDFIYNYVQTINTRPKLRRADIVLSGEIYQQEERLYEVPRSEPLTFYISSIQPLGSLSIPCRSTKRATPMPPCFAKSKSPSLAPTAPLSPSAHGVDMSLSLSTTLLSIPLTNPTSSSKATLSMPQLPAKVAVANQVS